MRAFLFSAVCIAAVLTAGCAAANPEKSALRVEGNDACGCAVAAVFGEEPGYFTPAHVYEAVAGKDGGAFQLAGEECNPVEVRISKSRDLVFFQLENDVSEYPRIEVEAQARAPRRVDFLLPALAQTDIADFRGRSGMPALGRHGEIGLFLGLKKDTHARVFVRLDNLTREEFSVLKTTRQTPGTTPKIPRDGK